MLKRLSTALLCGLAVAGQMRAQEVVVAGERKLDAPERATPPSGRMKPQVRENKSTPAVPTVEQMRMAGALAAERLNDRPLQETGAAAGSSSQTARAGISNASGAAEPVRKETRVEQTSAPRTPNSQTMKSGGIVPVRPTMIESGKQEADASPPAKRRLRASKQRRLNRLTSRPASRKLSRLDS